MYDPIEDDLLSQGDIVQNVVISYLPEISAPELILDAQAVDRDLADPFDPNEPLLVLATAHKCSVLVIEPSCNIDNGDFISVARIHARLSISNAPHSPRYRKRVRRACPLASTTPVPFRAHACLPVTI